NKIPVSGKAHRDGEVHVLNISCSKNLAYRGKVIRRHNHVRFRSNRNIELAFAVDAVKSVPASSIQVEESSCSIQIARWELLSNLVVVERRMPFMVNPEPI